jgi:hypothetical protein
MDKEPIVITDTEINLSINVMMDEKTHKEQNLVLGEKFKL